MNFRTAPWSSHNWAPRPGKWCTKLSSTSCTVTPSTWTSPYCWVNRCNAVGINTRTAITLSFCHDDLLRLRPTSWAGGSPLCAGSATAPSCRSTPRVSPIVYCSTNHPLVTGSLRHRVSALWFTRGVACRLGQARLGYMWFGCWTIEMDRSLS